MRSNAQWLIQILPLALLTGCAGPLAHHQALSVRGKDGVSYALNIFWDDIVYIPGDHAIRVITTGPDKRSRVRDFRSGNRAGLSSVSLVHKERHDEVVFHVASYYGPGFDYTNTVDASGFHGYPEMVRAFEESRKRGNRAEGSK